MSKKIKSQFLFKSSTLIFCISLLMLSNISLAQVVNRNSGVKVYSTNPKNNSSAAGDKVYSTRNFRESENMNRTRSIKQEEGIVYDTKNPALNLYLQLGIDPLGVGEYPTKSSHSHNSNMPIPTPPIIFVK